MSLSSLTLADYLILVIVIVSAGYAVWRGFLWETLSIFAWVAAVFACLYLEPTILPFVHSLVHIGWLATLLAYAVVFLAVFIPLAFISRRLSDGVKKSAIGSLDRIAGLGFGIVRGLVIVGLAYLAFGHFVRSQPRWLSEARLLPVVRSTADVLLSVIPGHLRGLTEIPREEDVRQAPGIQEDTGNQPAGAPASHDPMAELIRANEPADSGVKGTKDAAPRRSASRAAKSYGASDRQALDRLVESGGNR